MGTPVSSSSQVPQLYKRLAEHIAAENEEEVRRIYRELLRSGEPIRAIVGMAMSSAHRMDDRRESGGSAGAIDEPSGRQQVPVALRQSAGEVTLEQMAGVDLQVDRSECFPAALKRSDSAEKRDQRPNVSSARRRRLTVTSDPKTPESAERDEAAGLDIACNGFTEIADISADACAPPAV